MSTNLGNEAEAAAADYLIKLGYEIIDRNWRTPVCEIDIIARLDNIIFFAEVKYRSSDRQGPGLDYVTPQKLRQMQFAASCWVQATDYSGDYELVAIEVSREFVVTACIVGLD